jgi:hypothetical protein
MFCNHCGKSITEKSVYCSHCGSKQESIAPLNEEYKPEENKETIITEDKIKIFIKKNKDFIVLYLVWFILHLIFLLVNWHEDFQSPFWPFGKNSHFNDYDFTEFTFYMVTPLIIFVIWKLIEKDIKKPLDK